jgi:glycopeptide antibiotics resistance protein
MVDLSDPKVSRAYITAVIIACILFLIGTWFFIKMSKIDRSSVFTYNLFRSIALSFSGTAAGIMGSIVLGLVLPSGVRKDILGVRRVGRI